MLTLITNVLFLQMYCDECLHLISGLRRPEKFGDGWNPWSLWRAFNHTRCSSTSFGNVNAVILCRDRCFRPLHHVLQQQGLLRLHCVWAINKPVTKEKNKENELFRTIYSVWWVCWLCLGVQRVVGALTQLLYWVQEASGMYPSTGWILFLRSQRTTKIKTSAFQNIEQHLFFSTCAQFLYNQWSAHPTLC